MTSAWIGTFPHAISTPTKSRLGTPPGEPRKTPPGVVHFPMHKYYIVRLPNKLVGAPVDGEIMGTVKIPKRYRIWTGHAIDGGDAIEITESEYSTYQAFELFVEYECIETSLISFFGVPDYTVYIYNPTIYEVRNGCVEPIRT